jgi:hypothetical protein
MTSQSERDCLLRLDAPTGRVVIIADDCCGWEREP